MKRSKKKALCWLLACVLLLSLLPATAIPASAATIIGWDDLSVGMAPMMIGMFFLGAVQLIFIGVLGEYIGAILVRIRNRPLVIEEERLNFPPSRSGSTEE